MVRLGLELTQGEWRTLVVSLTLMTVCSSLLGVLVGWWLRGREVRRLETKLEIVRGELRKCWASKAARVGIRRMPVSRNSEYIECGAAYDGPNEDCKWMRCTKPAGHTGGTPGVGAGSKHGYAGVFW